MKEKRLLRNDEGSVVAVALIMLVLVTLLGIAAATTSTIEVQIAGNDKFHKKTFYAAEAGIEHGREDLRDGLAGAILPGQLSRWTFALADATDGVGGDGVGDFEGGVERIPETALDNCTYTVTVWNNDDGGGPNTDTDGLFFVRSVATHPSGAQSAIQVMLQSTGSGQIVGGYGAQEGAGSAKAYSSNDLSAIDFSKASSQL